MGACLTAGPSPNSVDACLIAGSSPNSVGACLIAGSSPNSVGAWLTTDNSPDRLLGTTFCDYNAFTGRCKNRIPTVRKTMVTGDRSLWFQAALGYIYLWSAGRNTVS